MPKDETQNKSIGGNKLIVTIVISMLVVHEYDIYIYTCVYKSASICYFMKPDLLACFWLHFVSLAYFSEGVEWSRLQSSCQSFFDGVTTMNPMYVKHRYVKKSVVY